MRPGTGKGMLVPFSDTNRDTYINGSYFAGAQNGQVQCFIFEWETERAHRVNRLG